jgi:cation diffusion facilitator CzcD-associated flavoprotein CzcO
VRVGGSRGIFIDHSSQPQDSAAATAAAGGADTALETVDVLIIGAGLSGIGAAVHLRRRCPAKSCAILEARDAIGGTWDLFRFPGVRSDSDMFTLGYSFRPWTSANAITDGSSIRRYIADAAREADIDPLIRFGHRVTKAAWCSDSARWTIEAARSGTQSPVRLRCRFLYVCSGYYSYESAHRPQFPNESSYGGTIVHPQFWPDQLDYTGKRVVVIGSGATAVTLIPAMAKAAAHVTMLQRSPSYVFSMPSVDAMANGLRRWLPAGVACHVARLKNVLIGMAFFQLARRRPELAKKRLVGMVQDQLPADFDVAKHFTPRYNPWDQRVCVVPDGDLFKAIGEGTVSVVTDEIDAFTHNGIRLKSGTELPADVIVTATGLTLNLLGGVEFTVDGARIDVSKCVAYKGAMLSDVPNMAYTFGYTNASWTLKADLTAKYVCRLIRYTDSRGLAVATPRRDPAMAEEPFLDFTSGYVVRARESLPKQGSLRPWKVYQNYLWDAFTLGWGRIDDGVLKFTTGRM